MTKSTAASGHNWSGQRPASTSVEDEEEDPVEKMLKKTGCIDLHYAVQECMAEHRDWRKCQNVVAEFRKCMEQHRQKNES